MRSICVKAFPKFRCTNSKNDRKKKLEEVTGLSAEVAFVTLNHLLDIVQTHVAGAEVRGSR